MTITATGGDLPHNPHTRIALGTTKGRLRTAYSQTYKPADGPLLRFGWNGDGEPRRRTIYGRIRPGQIDWLAYMRTEVTP